MSYWDTSCLIKLYVMESDSALFREHVKNRNETITSGDFARMEFMVAIRRKEAEGEIVAGSAERHLTHLDREIKAGNCLLMALDHAVRAEFENVVRRCYAQSPPVFIRTLDALHIATALVADETEIVATDKRLRDAATLLGFQLFPATNP